MSLPILDPATGIKEDAKFSVRPYARKCLEFANQYFEVAIFTASQKWFANDIIDYLDPNRNLVQHRYFREHTSELIGAGGKEKAIVKDLKVLTKGNKVRLEDILIIDNNVYPFALNLSNGIPINDYWGNKKDRALL